MMENHEKMKIMTTNLMILFLNDIDNEVKTLGFIYNGIPKRNLWLLITPSLAMNRKIRFLQCQLLLLRMLRKQA